MERLPIYMIESQSREVLASTFMRFQEYYESTEFKGRFFTVQEFANWYEAQYGSFSYCKDWYGFNIPSSVLEPFKNGNFDPLTSNEKQLLEVCKGATGDFYVIGVTPSAEYFDETVKHEFVHGAFYVNKGYRHDVVQCIQAHRPVTINNALQKMGYHRDVAADETNAYVLVEPETIAEYVSVEDTQKMRSRLDRIFNKHFGFSILTTPLINLAARINRICV